MEINEQKLKGILGEYKKDIEKVDITFIKNGLKKKVDAEEFETLERRVAVLEAKRAA